jgi:hypothetical protein
MRASNGNHTQTVKTLVAAGADKDMQNKVSTPRGILGCARVLRSQLGSTTELTSSFRFMCAVG